MALIAPQIVCRNFLNRIGQHDYALGKLLCKNPLRGLPAVKLFFVVGPCQLDFGFAVPQGGDFFIRFLFRLF